MLFHSVQFLIFFILFLVALRFFQGASRIYFVVLSSVAFYGWWYPPHVLVLLGLILYAHYASNCTHLSRLHYAMVISLGFVPLAIFKYWHFVTDNINSLATDLLPVPPKWQLPLGISFLTFTAIAYVDDVRRGVVVREKNLARTALFISYFPQLIAGPILRARELLPQLGRIDMKPSMFKFAFLLFAIGALKKVGLADQMAPAVEKIYGGNGPIDLPQALTAFYGFTVQIYCDFSGYSDMALALGYLLNTRFPRNFDRPYYAESVREFWRCWHMTLSRWLRDYLYVRLGGSHFGVQRTVLAALITMLIGGLWHGAAWTFVFWGLLHGAFIGAEVSIAALFPKRPKLPSWAARLLVFHLVSVGWVFFRAPSFDKAIDLFKGMATPGNWDYLVSTPLLPVLFGLFVLAHRFDRISTIRYLSFKASAAFIIPLSLGLILICAAMALNNPNAFIYFDF
jgi:alginate O-acetyltransferase complex protein AlgI